MSKELTKMNLIAIVQQLPEEDIHVIETYIKMIELENKNLKEELSKYLVKPNKKEFIYNIKDLQQENQSLKEQNKKEFADFIKFKQEQYDEYLERSNKVIKEKQHYKHIIDELEKWLKEEIKHYKEHFEFVCKNPSPILFDDKKIILEKDDLIIRKLESTLNKLQELKGSDQ